MHKKYVSKPFFIYYEKQQKSCLLTEDQDRRLVRKIVGSHWDIWSTTLLVATENMNVRILEFGFFFLSQHTHLLLGGSPEPSLTLVHSVFGLWTQPALSFLMQHAVSRSLSLSALISRSKTESQRMQGAYLAPKWIKSV
jgi:hypothetical protein